MTRELKPLFLISIGFQFQLSFIYVQWVSEANRSKTEPIVVILEHCRQKFKESPLYKSVLVILRCIIIARMIEKTIMNKIRAFSFAILEAFASVTDATLIAFNIPSEFRWRQLRFSDIQNIFTRTSPAGLIFKNSGAKSF